MGYLSILFAIGLGIVWLRQALRNWKVKNESGKLKNGVMSTDGFDKIRDEFDTLILTRPADAYLNFTGATKDALYFSLNSKAQQTYNIKNVTARGGVEVIAVADAIVKDFLPTRNGGRYIDKAYPCSIYGFIDRAENKISFWGNFPVDKRHEHLIKDFADLIIRFCESGIAIHNQ